MGRGTSLVLHVSLSIAEATLWMYHVELTVIPLPLWPEFFFNLSLLNLQALFFMVFTPFIDPASECPGRDSSRNS